jgi:hypothetical protein
MKNYVYKLTPSGFVIIKCVQCLFRFSWHCPPLNVIIAHKAFESALLVCERHAITAVKSWSLSGKKPLVLMAQLRTNKSNTTYLTRNVTVFIATLTNAPLVYYKIISLDVSTLLGHHQGFKWNTKSLQFKMCIKYLHKIYILKCVRV